MALYTNIPAIVNDLVARARAEADADSQPLTKFDLIGTVYWYDLPTKLRLFKEALELYQTFLLDGDLQDLLDELGNIYWFDIFKKVSIFIEAVELIENI